MMVVCYGGGGGICTPTLRNENDFRTACLRNMLFSLEIRLRQESFPSKTPFDTQKGAFSSVFFFSSLGIHTFFLHPPPPLTPRGRLGVGCYISCSVLL